MSSPRWWNPVSRWWRPARRVAEAVQGSAVAGAAFIAAGVGTEPAQAAPARPVATLAIEPAAPPAPAIPPEVLRGRLVAWIIGVPAAGPATVAPPLVVREVLFERLDEVTASDTLRAALLPRAPHVVPQLMKALRDEGYSSVDVADKISRDAMLTAEVIRSATSVSQRGEDADADVDLAWAVAAIGTQGLRRAIASVVLRPIFDARGDTLSSRAATQIWKDGERKARLCSALAAQASLDPFDGYLAGLLHNSGWTALLRAIDGFQDIPIDAEALAHPALVAPLLRRRDALFGALVQPWKLSPAVDLLAAEVGAGGLESAQSPLGQALREAERLASLRAIAPAGQQPSAGVHDWAMLPKPLQECYSGLSKA